MVKLYLFEQRDRKILVLGSVVLNVCCGSRGWWSVMADGNLSRPLLWVVLERCDHFGKLGFVENVLE